MTLDQKREIVREEIIKNTTKMANFPKNTPTARHPKYDKVARLLATNNYGCKTEVIQKLLEEVLQPEDLQEAFVEGAKWARELKIAPAGARDEAGKRFSRVDLSINLKGITYFKGAAIVPIANPNDHNYTIGSTVVTRENRRGWFFSGDLLVKGNSLPGEGVRMATEEEILAFVGKLSEKDIGHILLVVAETEGDEGSFAEGEGLIR